MFLPCHIFCLYIKVVRLVYMFWLDKSKQGLDKPKQGLDKLKQILH